MTNDERPETISGRMRVAAEWLDLYDQFFGAMDIESSDPTFVENFQEAKRNLGSGVQDALLEDARSVETLEAENTDLRARSKIEREHHHHLAARISRREIERDKAEAERDRLAAWKAAALAVIEDVRPKNEDDDIRSDYDRGDHDGQVYACDAITRRINELDS